MSDPMTTPPLTDAELQEARRLAGIGLKSTRDLVDLARFVPRLLDALATAREERDAAVTKAERWRNCFVCVECGRGKADEEGCCATCGRDVLIFEGGKLTRPLSHFYDRDAIETEADEVEAERDSLRSSLATATARVAEVEAERDECGLDPQVAALKVELAMRQRTADAVAQLHLEIAPYLAARDARIRELEAALARVGEVLSANGCDCDCDHGWDDHEDDCERCLACRIETAMKPEPTT